MKVISLARRPFVNTRPVVRFATLAWLVGAALLAWNVWLYTSYWSDSAEIRQRLAQVAATTRDAETSFASLDRRFAELDLEKLNDQTAFLNQLIRNRTFPWSELFEDLETVLPIDTRLLSLEPELISAEVPQGRARKVVQRPLGRKSSSRSAPAEAAPAPATLPPAPPPEEVDLRLLGTAKPGDSLLQLVDALYAHPAFRDPLLSHENLDSATRLVAFDIQVTYLVRRPAAPATTAPTTTTAEQNADGETVDGETADGETADGETADGETVDGETADSETAAAPKTSAASAASAATADSGDTRRSPHTPGGKTTVTEAPPPPAATAAPRTQNRQTLPSRSGPQIVVPAAATPAPAATTAPPPTRRATEARSPGHATPEPDRATAPPPVAQGSETPSKPQLHPRFVTPTASSTPRPQGGGK